MLHLDDPVMEFIPLIRRAQSYTLSELPMGKYIVCGEAMVMGEVYQASCFQTNINRLDNNSKLLSKTIIGTFFVSRIAGWCEGDHRDLPGHGGHGHCLRCPLSIVQEIQQKINQSR